VGREINHGAVTAKVINKKSNHQIKVKYGIQIFSHHALATSVCFGCKQWDDSSGVSRFNLGAEIAIMARSGR
jgi:hypothetical protein